jgi:hypothetical protein
MKANVLKNVMEVKKKIWNNEFKYCKISIHVSGPVSVFYSNKYINTKGGNS